MREILFRGKRIDKGEWVYGAYITMHHNDERTHTHHFIIPDGSDLSYGVKVEDILVAVDGESVCQYTGLKDKNRNNIFEGDIVKDKSAQLLGVVKYSEKYMQFIVDDIDDGEQDCSGFINDVEIIGNIFDNPELLEVQNG